MHPSIADLANEQIIAKQYPDFPENFIPPWLLNPNGYIPPSRQPAILAVTIISTALMTAVVGARFLIRGYFRRGTWGWDDTLMVPTYLLALALAALEVYTTVAGGVGYHSYDLTWDQLKLDYKLAYVILIVYCLTTLFIKLSIIAFYWRLQAQQDTFFRRTLPVLAVWCCSLTITSVMLLTFEYKPISTAWDLTKKLGPFTGLDTYKLTLGLSIAYAVTDVMILVMPMPTLLNLHMPVVRRIKLITLFGLGGIACIAVIVRTIYLGSWVNSFDPTWRGVAITLCDQLEVTIAIAAASIPSISAVMEAAIFSGKSALQYWWSSFKSRLTSRGGYGSYYRSNTYAEDPQSVSSRRMAKKSQTSQSDRSGTTIFTDEYDNEKNSISVTASSPGFNDGLKGGLKQQSIAMTTIDIQRDPQDSPMSDKPKSRFNVFARKDHGLRNFLNFTTNNDSMAASRRDHSHYDEETGSYHSATDNESQSRKPSRFSRSKNSAAMMQRSQLDPIDLYGSTLDPMDCDYGTHEDYVPTQHLPQVPDRTLDYPRRLSLAPRVGPTPLLPPAPQSPPYSENGSTASDTDIGLPIQGNIPRR